MGLSLTELSKMTMQDFADFVQMWAGVDKDDDRYATQDDIDAVFG
jgi:hypothetical protein